MALLAQDFIRKWRQGSPAFELNERAGAQAHFIDLCRVLGVPEPGDPESYCFERGLSKTGSTAVDGRHRTDGFADVWLKGHFAWEYKAPGRSLEGALKQLMMYALPLENPPLLVVSDRQRIEVHTHFTGMPSEKHVFALEDMAQPEVQQRLRALWLQPDAFRPKRSNRDITEQAAQAFAGTAERLRAAGTPPEQVSHFLTQCVFCFFAEDVGLLPTRLFERLVGVAISPERLRAQLGKLFEAMRDGGLFGVDDVPWFNGGLFQRIDVPALAEPDVGALKAASALNWSAIDATIFGTLFERGLDPAKRSQLGAQFTDTGTILRLVEPVVQRPLLAEWQEHKARIEAGMTKSRKHGDKAWRDAQAAFVGFLERLRAFRVLDPACGSGNFLYLALKCLKDIEHQVNLEAEALGLERQHDVTGPHNVLGIELNEYAAELARVTVWIGELQWRIQRGYGFKLNPVLEPLQHIECRDAVLNAEGTEAAWPVADVVVGNPPFLGGKKFVSELGEDYAASLRRVYIGRVPGLADLVAYWFERARVEVTSGRCRLVGFVSTNSLRDGFGREVLSKVNADAPIFDAWSDQPWVNDGAAVRVSLIAFGKDVSSRTLEGAPVARINDDLTPGGDTCSPDTTAAVTLSANRNVAFQGTTRSGPFDVAGGLARRWLLSPNPNGRSNSEVVRPWSNGRAVTQRPVDTWVIDFGTGMPESEACLFELPFEHCRVHVRPTRLGNRNTRLVEQWWHYDGVRVGMRRALDPLPRYIATSLTARHRMFVWLDPSKLADATLVVVARADETTMGFLQARHHVLWALTVGSRLGVGNDCRYVHTTCFETFPFPAGLTPADTAHQRTETLEGGALIPADLPPAVRAHAESIARAAKRLTDLRDAWLNPPEWTERVPEVVPLGMDHSPYPDRIVAKPGFEKDLAKRTLTNLYNQRPAWLAQAHESLDAAVAAAYGWADYTPAMPDEEILRRLLALNLERAAGQ